MSPSRWLPAERSTADSSCSSTSPRCSPVHPARTPLPDRAPLSEPRHVRMGMTLAGNPLHEDDAALTFTGLLGEVIRAWRRVALARRRPDHFMTHLSMSEGGAEWGEHVGESECRGQG